MLLFLVERKIYRSDKRLYQPIQEATIRYRRVVVLWCHVPGCKCSTSESNSRFGFVPDELRIQLGYRQLNESKIRIYGAIKS